MKRRSDAGPVRDMRDHAGEAVETFQAASADALENDRTLDRALRYLETGLRRAEESTVPRVGV